MPRGLLPPEYRYFYEVAKSGSIRKAAELLHVSPSALSRQIQRTEDALGTRLIDRRKTGVQLTAAGEMLLQHVRETFTSEEQLRVELANLAGLRRGHVRIVCGEGFLPDLFGKPLQTFAQKYPGVSFGVSVIGSDGIVQAIVQEQAEIGLIFGAPADTRLAVLHRCIQPLYAIVAQGHPLAARRSVTLKHVSSHPIALQPPSHGVHQLIAAVARKHRVSITPRFTCNSTFALKACAQHYGAVAVLPCFAVAPELALRHLIAVPLNEAACRNGEVQMITRTGRKPSHVVLQLASHLAASMIAFRAP
jgi:DNA-binding transcriptional LysR family regulator